jgi:cytochrome c-type biogenesis protein CcmH
VRTLILTLSIALAAPAFADSKLPPSEWADRQLPDARQEAAARALMEETRCLVCQGQSIADSDADMAGDMRAMIRERIAGGERPADIRRWMIDRYGDWITFRPPVDGLTWPLYVVPLMLLALGAFLAAGRLRRRK